jgi:hypothetical protein
MCEPERSFDPETQPTRAARNQALFREVNERIEQLGETFDLDPLQLVCECADIYCSRLLPMSAAAYWETRADPTTFIVLPGHIVPNIEYPVHSTEDYVIVKKVGLAGGIAEIAEIQHSS